MKNNENKHKASVDMLNHQNIEQKFKVGVLKEL